jgi:hypothetical protein
LALANGILCQNKEALAEIFTMLLKSMAAISAKALFIY